MLKFMLGLSFLLFYSNWGGVIFMLSFFSFFYLLNSYEFSTTNISYMLEIDSLSSSLIFLSLWVIILCYLSSFSIFNKNMSASLFSLMLMSLLIFLFLSFSVNNYLMFYFSFECSLIPILFLILGWGYQPERSQAGLYMMFYTLAASLPLLMIILSFKNNNSLLMFFNQSVSMGVEGILNVFLIGAFLVKFPMYITHLWLPKAHVEAPVAGSMILAGVLLKLGGYGIIRFLSMSSEFSLSLQSVLISLSVWGGFIVSLNCLSQLDMKSLIACSSVVHMSTCIGCLLIMSDWATAGAIIMMIAHGLCSSGLFFLAGMIYERSGSRSLTVNKGLINLMPSMSLWWFLLLAANMAAPPTINLLSEISMISGLVSWSSLLIFPLLVLIFFSGAYSIYLFSLSQHGKFVLSSQGFYSSSMIDMLIVFLHWAPLNLFILFPMFIV